MALIAGPHHVFARPCAGDLGGQLHEIPVPAPEELPEKNTDSHITKSLYHKTCDKCQNPNMLGQVKRGSVSLAQADKGGLPRRGDI